MRPSLCSALCILAAAPAASAQHVPGTPSLALGGEPCLGRSVRIEGPMASARALQVPVVDLSSDSLQSTTACMQGNLLIVEATANSAPTGILSFSVEGFSFESPMR